MELHQLVAAACEGDVRAFEHLVKSQADRLYRIAYRVTGDREMADDVLQETFLRLLSSPPSARPVHSGDSWLTRVTVRVAINLARSQRARRRREEQYALQRRKEAHVNPSEPHLPLDLDSEVSAAFQILSLETRVAVWLHVVEGEGVREVAKCLESSRSAVWRQIRSGLETMRRRLRRRDRTLLGATSLEGTLRALRGPAPDAPLVEAILASGKASCGRASSSDVGAPPGPLQAEISGGLFTISKVTLSLALSLAFVTGSIALVYFWERRDPPPESRERLARAAAPALSERSGPREETGELPRSPPQSARKRGEPHQMNGTVVFQGGPIEGARVRVLRDRDGERLGWSFERVYVRGEFGAFFDQAFEPPEILGETTTDAEGRFQLTARGSGVALLEASKAVGEGAFLGGLLPLDMPEDTEEEILLRVDPDGFLSGTVRNPEGKGVAGAAVIAFPLHDDLYRACTGQISHLAKQRELRTTVYLRIREAIESFDVSCTATAADGSFLFPMLDSTHAYLIAARSRGRAGAFVKPVKVPAAGVEILLPALEAIPGEAVILPDAAPATGAKIVVIGGIRSPGKWPNRFRSVWFDLIQSDSGGWFDAVESNSDGRFTANGGSPGSGGYAFGLLEQSGAFHPAGTEWNAEHQLDLPLRIEFEPRVHISEGRVLNASNGLPLAGARVMYYTGAYGVLYVAGDVYTDEGGRFSLATGGDPFGLIIAELEGYAPGGCLGKEHNWLNPSASPAAQAILSTQDIYLTPSPTIRGTVVGPGGLPVPDCLLEVRTCTPIPHPAHFLLKRLEAGSKAEFSRFVAQSFYAENRPGSTSPLPPPCQAWTGENGQFEIPQPFGNGNLVLRAHHSELGEVLAGPLGGFSGEPPRLNINLELPGSAVVEFLVTDGASGALSGIPVTIEVAQNVALEECLQLLRREADQEAGSEPSLQSPKLVPGRRTGKTDAFGKCLFRIPGGASFGFSLQTGSWRCSADVPQPLQPGESRFLEIPLQRDRILRGRVIDEAGRGVRVPLNVSCRCDADPGGDVERLYMTGGTSGEDGSFEIIAAGPGPFDVIVRTRGFREVKLTKVQAGIGEISIRVERE